MNRRSFLTTAGATAGAAAVAVLPRRVLGGPGHVAPSQRVALAHIGMGTQGFRELGGLLKDPNIQVTAVCDPNTDSSDYVEWGKGSVRRSIRGYLGDPSWRAGDDGCPGGREVGRRVVDAYYAKHRGKQNYKACAAYADYRDLLEREKDLDAVKIMTPDHLHAWIAVAAMKKGKHVVMHKPIANRLHEGRRVLQTARETKVATHLLAYGAGAGNGRICEAIKDGAIGRLREIHNWTNRPVWPQYAQMPTDRPPVPKGFDWDLWLGPARPRPYHPHYTHTVFRGWYDFGGGSMADMGIYSLWPVFAGLDLPSPASAQAWATHQCTLVDNTSRTIRNDFSYPTACSIRFHVAGGKDRPALDLFWYDGGMKPRLPEALEAQNVAIDREGILFVGDEGAILAKFTGGNPQRFAKGKREPLQTPKDGAGSGPRGSWHDAIAGGPPSPGNFLAAAAITDAVNLGTVALRAGRKVVFDADQARITDPAHANPYLTRDCRDGWTL